MQNFLIFGLGFIVGVLLVALLGANKPDDIEHEKAENTSKAIIKDLKMVVITKSN